MHHSEALPRLLMAVVYITRVRARQNERTRSLSTFQPDLTCRRVLGADIVKRMRELRRQGPGGI